MKRALKLPTQISNIEDAKSFLRYLDNTGLNYHLDDNANECLKGRANATDCDKINELMQQVLKVENFDAYLYALLCSYAFRIKDLTGRGNSYTTTGNSIVDDLPSIPQDEDEDDAEIAETRQIKDFVEGTDIDSTLNVGHTLYTRIW